MTETLEYFIQSSAILAIFYLIYFLFLRNERYFVEIRVYLILSLILAAVLPFVKIPYTVLVQSSEVIMPSFDFTPTTTGISEMDKKQVDLVQILLLIYVVVALAMLFRSCLKIWQIFNLIKGKQAIDVDNCKVFLMDNKIPAFSFFGYIIINKEEYHNDTNNNIFIHEKVHAMQKHWIDLLLIELMSIVFWFNPFVWLFQIAIKQTHELLADDGVIARGFGIGQYQAILINQLMGAEVVGLANNFNYSLNKKRMIMMSKEKGPKIRRYKLLLMIPAIAFILAFNMQTIEVIAQNNEVIETAKKDEVKISGVILSQDDNPIPGAAIILEGATVGTVSDVKGKFEFLVAKDANVNISFVGLETRTMAVEDFILNGKETENGYFLIIKLKEAKGMNVKAITPDGKSMKLRAQYLEIGEKPSPKRSYSSNDDEIVFVIVENMPEFPGGQDGLKKYIKESIVYPKVAKENGIKGRVFVTFVVNKDGNVVKTRVVRGVDPSLDKEALRVIKEMPKWEPGMQRGKKVNVSYTVPINFGIEDSKSDHKEIEVMSSSAKSEMTKPRKLKNSDVFVIVEDMPEFPGGQLALKEYIEEKVNALPTKYHINKRCFVTFVVNKRGKITNARVVRGTGNKEVDAMALKITKRQPQWKPGMQRGKKVKVSYTIPINFKME